MGVDIGGAVCVGVLVGVFFLLPRFVCLVVCLVDGSSSFVQVHALLDWHFPHPAGLLPLELSTVLPVELSMVPHSFLRSDFCRRLVLHSTIVIDCEDGWEQKCEWYSMVEVEVRCFARQVVAPNSLQ